MVSKRWQRSQTFIAHLALASAGAVPFGIFETPYASPVKLTLVVLCYLILYPVFRYLHRRFATDFVKVIVCDYEVAARTIQRAFNAQYLRYSKVDDDDRVVFNIRTGDMQLNVEAFVLNLMIDDHLTDQTATKLTLSPETASNKAQMQQIRQSIDYAFAQLKLSSA